MHVSFVHYNQLLHKLGSMGYVYSQGKFAACCIHIPFFLSFSIFIYNALHFKAPQHMSTERGIPVLLLWYTLVGNKCHKK